MQRLFILFIVSIIGLLWLVSIKRGARLRGWRRTILVPSFGMYLFYLYSISAAVGLLVGLYGLASAVLWVAIAVVVLVVLLKPMSSQAEAEERSEHEEFARLVSKARDLTIGSTCIAPIVIEVTHGRVSKATGIQELRELIDSAVNKK